MIGKIGLVSNATAFGPLLNMIENINFDPRSFANGKRLTTSMGAYTWSNDQMAGWFRQICPHEVKWGSNAWDHDVRTTMINWCLENCTGYWSCSMILRESRYPLFASPVWIFQDLDEAVMFKLNLPL